ncbi:unnamed protein product [Tenebrio molitor]|jgi:hypothetical protein|nr:unnamed protein product [Tenebrio molitor]
MFTALHPRGRGAVCIRISLRSVCVILFSCQRRRRIVAFIKVVLSSSFSIIAVKPERGRDGLAPPGTRVYSLNFVVLVQSQTPLGGHSAKWKFLIRKEYGMYGLFS